MSDWTAPLGAAGFKDSKGHFWLSHCRRTQADIHRPKRETCGRVTVSRFSLLSFEMAACLSCFNSRPASPCVSLCGSVLTLVWLVRWRAFVAQHDMQTSASFTFVVGFFLWLLARSVTTTTKGMERAQNKGRNVTKRGPLCRREGGRAGGRPHLPSRLGWITANIKSAETHKLEGRLAA